MRYGLWLLLAFACSSGKKTAPPTTIPECDEYLREYQRCMSLTGNDPNLQQRVRQMSSAYTSALSAPDAAAASLQKEQCRVGTERLRTSCR